MTKYKIDKTRNIGNVIFVVEGGRPETGGTELRLLKKIFADILRYEVQELRRGSDEFIGYGSNRHFRVFALNLPKNQLTQLTEDAIDKLFERLRGEFDIKPEDCPIFYLYDRDVLSYKLNELSDKYALLIKGARRVGKSTIAEEFAKNEFKSYVLRDCKCSDRILLL